MTVQTAYLLVAHGSRDARYPVALARLTDLVASELAKKGAAKWALTQDHSPATPPQQLPQVHSACLECQPHSLTEQLINLGIQLRQQGFQRVKVLPLFLLPGVHVCEDLPTELTAIQAYFGNSLHWQALPYLGSGSGMATLLANRFQQAQSTYPQTQRLLLSHGSRHPGVKQTLEQLAHTLQAQVAFAKSEPRFQSILAQVDPTHPVIVLPYFLFAGGITDWLQEEFCTWQAAHQQPSVWEKPIGATPDLAHLLAAIFQNHLPEQDNAEQLMFMA